ncbi:MAG: questin oxidase family protein [Candidatus Melainabacteria bacterium]|nr:questin oxidase family protein [Candidatus Melainabacteria bacterium]
MDDAIDVALEILKNTGPEFGPGFSNHGPMAAEAMITLDRSEKVKHWTELYKKRLRDEPRPKESVTEQNWLEALGRQDRVGDWIVFFENQLKEDSWQNAIAKWVPILAPGMMAGGTHGIIRTGHATRSLTRGENELRLHELAEGLAYWASSYLRLPGTRTTAGCLRPPKAIDTVPVVPKEELGHYKLIDESMQALSLLPTFPEVVNTVDVSGNYSTFLSELTETTAACYLANAVSIGHAIAFIHTVTAPSMLRVMMPYVSQEHHDEVLSYVWQAAMGLFAVSGQDGKFAGCDAQDESREELIDRAVRTTDEHAIKFAEACLREHTLNPKPIYLAATSHASRLIGKEPVTPALAKC